MNKKIGFIGNPASMPPGKKGNTGNIVHGHAAREFFKSHGNVSTNTDSNSISLVRQNYSHIGIIAATVLNVGTKHPFIERQSAIAKFVEKAGLPVCTFGIGSHAQLGQSIGDADVDERSITLLRVLAEHSNFIAVRGEFTADLCVKFGVKNVEVIGCQSAYYSTCNQDPANFLDSPDNKAAAVTLTESVDEKDVLKFSLDNQIDFIGQGDSIEEKIAQGIVSEIDYVNSASIWKPNFLKRCFAKGIFSQQEYFSYILHNYYKFYDVQSWKNHLRNNYSFVFGSRFHGNMIALQCGIPALWLVHDARTEELCKFLGLPYIYHSDFMKYATLERLKNACDYSTFRSNMPKNLARFISYLKKNDVLDIVDTSFLKSAERWSPGVREASDSQ